MSLYFICSNLKVNPFILQDKPLPGFNLLSWDNETSVEGSLWELDCGDAAYSKIITTSVRGQLWKLEDPDPDNISFLEDCVGVSKGICAPLEVNVTVTINELEKQQLRAITFALNRIIPNYKLIKDGRWKF